MAAGAAVGDRALEAAGAGKKKAYGSKVEAFSPYALLSPTSRAPTIKPLSRPSPRVLSVLRL